MKLSRKCSEKHNPQSSRKSPKRNHTGKIRELLDYEAGNTIEIFGHCDDDFNRTSSPLLSDAEENDNNGDANIRVFRRAGERAEYLSDFGFCIEGLIDALKEIEVLSPSLFQISSRLNDLNDLLANPAARSFLFTASSKDSSNRSEDLLRVCLGILRGRELHRQRDIIWDIYSERSILGDLSQIAFHLSSMTSSPVSCTISLSSGLSCRNTPSLFLNTKPQQLSSNIVQIRCPLILSSSGAQVVTKLITAIVEHFKLQSTALGTLYDIPIDKSSPQTLLTTPSFLKRKKGVVLISCGAGISSPSSNSEAQFGASSDAATQHHLPASFSFVFRVLSILGDFAVDLKSTLGMTKKEDTNNKSNPLSLIISFIASLVRANGELLNQITKETLPLFSSELLVSDINRSKKIGTGETSSPNPYSTLPHAYSKDNAVNNSPDDQNPIVIAINEWWGFLSTVTALDKTLIFTVNASSGSTEFNRDASPWEADNDNQIAINSRLFKVPGYHSSGISPSSPTFHSSPKPSEGISNCSLLKSMFDVCKAILIRSIPLCQNAHVSSSYNPSDWMENTENDNITKSLLFHSVTLMSYLSNYSTEFQYLIQNDYMTHSSSFHASNSCDPPVLVLLIKLLYTTQSASSFSFRAAVVSSLTYIFQIDNDRFIKSLRAQPVDFFVLPWIPCSSTNSNPILISDALSSSSAHVCLVQALSACIACLGSVYQQTSENLCQRLEEVAQSAANQRQLAISKNAGNSKDYNQIKTSSTDEQIAATNKVPSTRDEIVNEKSNKNNDDQDNSNESVQLSDNDTKTLQFWKEVPQIAMKQHLLLSQLSMMLGYLLRGDRMLYKKEVSTYITSSDILVDPVKLFVQFQQSAGMLTWQGIVCAHRALKSIATASSSLAQGDCSEDGDDTRGEDAQEDMYDSKDMDIGDNKKTLNVESTSYTSPVNQMSVSRKLISYELHNEYPFSNISCVDDLSPFRRSRGLRSTSASNPYRLTFPRPDSTVTSKMLDVSSSLPSRQHFIESSKMQSRLGAQETLLASRKSQFVRMANNNQSTTTDVTTSCQELINSCFEHSLSPSSLPNKEPLPTFPTTAPEAFSLTSFSSPDQLIRKRRGVQKNLVIKPHFIDREAKLLRKQLPDETFIINEPSSDGKTAYDSSQGQDDNKRDKCRKMREKAGHIERKKGFVRNADLRYQNFNRSNNNAGTSQSQTKRQRNYEDCDDDSLFTLTSPVRRRLTNARWISMDDCRRSTMVRQKLISNERQQNQCDDQSQGQGNTDRNCDPSDPQDLRYKELRSRGLRGTEKEPVVSEIISHSRTIGTACLLKRKRTTPSPLTEASPIRNISLRNISTFDPELFSSSDSSNLTSPFSSPPFTSTTLSKCRKKCEKL